MSVNDRQVGGSHYGPGSALQHWDIVEMFGVGYLEGCATKYVSRYMRKNGKEDLDKAAHYVDKLIEVSGGSEPIESLVGTYAIVWPRIARGWVPPPVLKRWYEENPQLGATEQSICNILLGRWTRAQLDIARGHINHLAYQYVVDERCEAEAKRS